MNHFCLNVVPTAPRNFSLTRVDGDPNALMASWMAPDPAHGVLSAYTIRCNVPGPPSVVIDPFTFDDAVSEGTLPGLTPYTEYSCVISATTGAGEGDQSDPEMARTDEGGKLNRYHDHSVCLSVCLSHFCMSVSISLSVSPYAVCLHFCLSVSISVCLSPFMSVCLHLCLSVCLHFCLSPFMPVCLHFCLSMSPFLSVCLHFCLSVSISVCLSVGP